MYSVIFLCLSFALVAVFVMNVLMARRESILPQHLIDGFEAHLNAKKYQEAYELAKNDESFLGKVLSAGLARLSSGYPQAIEAMQEVGEEENMKLEHRLSYLALIGTISPMFGLLGTVDGMVQAFERDRPLDRLAQAVRTGRAASRWPSSRRSSACGWRFRPSRRSTSFATGSPAWCWRSASSAKT